MKEETLFQKVTKKCIWRDVALWNSASVEYNRDLRYCRDKCDGYNDKCQYYFTQRKS